MKITLLQTDIAWFDPMANMQHAAQLMDAAPDSDLYVLPEMWATGFCTEPGAAWSDETAVLAWMRRQAAARDCAVAGTVAVRVAGEAAHGAMRGAAGGINLRRNRFCFVRPDGSTDRYDKRNLFVYGGENRTFAPGTERVIAEWRGVRFMLQVCFDLRFPETARNVLPAPYDVLLYAANWPVSRRTAWDALLPARAVENQAFVVGVNRTGTDRPSAADAIVYDGGSAAYDACGRCLARLDARPQAVTVDIDVEALHRFRTGFPVLGS